MVGHTRRIVLGKLTGANAIKAKLDKYGIELDDEQFRKVFNQIKGLGDRGKSITDADLKSMAENILERPKRDSET